MGYISATMVAEDCSVGYFIIAHDQTVLSGGAPGPSSPPTAAGTVSRKDNWPAHPHCHPVGFGKTALISEWHASEAGRKFPLAWLALDDDNNPAPRATQISVHESLAYQ